MYSHTEEDKADEASTAEEATNDFYASFGYGNSAKSRARRAEARKGKTTHKVKRYGTLRHNDNLFLFFKYNNNKEA
jgi:hypothetical protein